MAGIIRFRLHTLRPRLSRNISTSKSNKDTSTAAKEIVNQFEISEVRKSKNWVSFGFDNKNEFKDRQATHYIFFGGITCCMVGGLFISYYKPDFRLKDWSQREAFIELRRRERLGLPLIDPNIVDPKKFTLPTDEELGDTEIVI